MRINNEHWLISRPIAHRGLWNDEIIENSITSYVNAVKNGFPIEIDLFSSTDGVLYSFHDDSLFRMTGVNGKIYEKSSTGLDGLFLAGTTEKIPTFKKVLETVNGLVPILIEIKNQPRKDIVEMIVGALKDYKGEIAIQSFNPLYIKKVKKLAPSIIRGILATNSDEDLKNEKPFTKFVIKNMALNFLIKPDFISYNYLGLPLKKRKTKNKRVIAWTIVDEKELEKIKSFSDNYIFENFIPKT